jgi:hypothetical protein
MDFAARAEIYDPVYGAFSRTADMPTAHQVHTATLLGDGTVLVAGGFAPYPVITSNAEIYHPAVLVPSPQLSSISGDGKGQGAIQHEDTYQSVSPANPGVQERSWCCTALGPSSTGCDRGMMAEVFEFGNAPVYPGLNQIKVRMPGAVVAGDGESVRVNYLGRPSNEVTVAVRPINRG